MQQGVRETLRVDSGWAAEALRTEAAMLVLEAARVLSQAARQQEAKTKLRSRDRSREAKKDRKRQGEEQEQ